ncbi:MAG: cytochrome c-type biogenesis protein CcmH [Candidatus Competibacterales bacterium]
MRGLALGLLLALGVSGPGMAAVTDVFEFDSPAQQEQYYQLVDELRCPKCQNQNLKDSNAPLARDLRHKVHELLTAQRDPQEIKAYMVERYGDFVTYRPPLRADTALLWFGPAVAMGAALLAMGVWVRRRRPPPSTLSDTERARLDQLLSRGDDGR